MVSMGDLKKAVDPRTPFKPPKPEDVRDGIIQHTQDVIDNPQDPGKYHAESGKQLEGAFDNLHTAWQTMRGNRSTGGETAEEAAAKRAAAEKAASEMAAAAAERKGHVDTARGRQSQLAVQLGQQAAGVGGPTAAQAQLQSATDQNMRSALAMAASGRGNAALAGQNAGRQRALMGQQAAQQSAALRAEEQQSAQAQLGSVLQGMQQTELGIEQQFIAREQMQANAEAAAKQRAVDRAATRSGATGSQQGGIMGMGSAVIAALSDETTKKDKKDVPDSDVTEFYKALESKTYKYKDPHQVGASEGEKVGMMAQDVDQTELGKKLFTEGPDGKKRYDPQVLDGILLAGMKKLMKEQKYGDD